MPRYDRGSTGPHVTILQEKLEARRYPLPRFGADGDLGNETISALESWAVDFGIETAENGLDDLEVHPTALEFLEYYDSVEARIDHPRLTRLEGLVSNVKRVRDMTRIDALVFHQTGCRIKTIKQWETVPIHVGVPREEPHLGRFFKIHELSSYLYHANALNSRSIGFEIEGNFAGIEGDSSTVWTPGGGPHELLPEQVEAARAAIDWTMQAMETAGSTIRFAFAHRQSSPNRVGDPGSAIWKEIALWAIREYGLEDGGSRFAVGKGRPLPDAWTDSPRGVNYV